MNEVSPDLFYPPNGPRPPHLGPVGCEWQSRYGRTRDDAYFGIESSNRRDPSDPESMTLGTAEVYRDRHTDRAELRLSICERAVEVCLQFDPTALRELAACLLDAAHDIENLPARAYRQI